MRQPIMNMSWHPPWLGNPAHQVEDATEPAWYCVTLSPRKVLRRVPDVMMALATLRSVIFDGARISAARRAGHYVSRQLSAFLRVTAASRFGPSHSCQTFRKARPVLLTRAAYMSIGVEYRL
jgi:hypothetical protein